MAVKILKIVQNGWHFLRNRSRQKPKQNLLLLMEYAEAAQKDLLHAQKMYQTAVEPELIDYASYLIKAHESYCLYLTRCIEAEKERTKKKFDANNDKNSVLIYNKII